MPVDFSKANRKKRKLTKGHREVRMWVQSVFAEEVGIHREGAYLGPAQKYVPILIW